MKDPPSASPSGFPDQSSEVLLDSWKEIAAYVKRDISTVQRWEKREGMPVHRHVHDKRGSVYALTSELDAWLQGRKMRLDKEEKESKEKAAGNAEGSRGQAETPQRRRPLVLVGVVALTLVGVGSILTRNRSTEEARLKINSLAVLPLKNLSGDPQQQYLVDGLTDELTTDLAKLGNLSVISRTSAVTYRDTQKTSQQIANELNVDALLMGTVERSSGRVRVRVNLVRGATDEIIWASSYDRDLVDTLRLEGEVSQAIAGEVGIKLTPQVQHRLEHKTTENPEARDAYLRARYFLERNDKEGATKCLQYFQEAIAKDPNYAAAYAGLSACYDPVHAFGLLSPNEASSKAKAAAMKAVELDEELAEGHAELAAVYFWQEWNFTAAERQYRRALELDPILSAAHSDYSFLLRDTGRTDQAVKEVQRGRELDPLSVERVNEVGWQLVYARRYDEALSEFHTVLEMDPNYRQARWGIVRTYELKGMYKDAINECPKIAALPNIDRTAKARFKTRCSLYEKIYTVNGAERFNRRWFESASQQIKDAIGRDSDGYFVAALYAETGIAEKALDLLERAYAQHDNELLQIKVDPRLDGLRSNARFQALLRRMSFPE